MIGWFIAPYKRRDRAGRIGRYCAMDDFTASIAVDGGDWRESEILGDRAIVKVKASAATLTSIANAVGITRIPATLLDDPLSSLTAGQRTAIRNAVLDAGYTVNEVNTRFPNLANNTLGDVLRFMATRRLKPRYDSGTDTIVMDGVQVACKSIDEVDSEVQ